MIIYREISSLELDLGFSAKTLYAVSNNINKHYSAKTVPKRNGGYRRLTIPDKILKSIQKNITEKLILPMGISQYAKAYYPSCNTLRNAIPHINKNIILKLDILGFFDSIRYIDVKNKAFPEAVYAEPFRILLTMLCYYNDSLPQGAPSSPAISNVIMFNFDEYLGKWCADQNIIYSRYCDDLTFSGNFNPDTVISFVRNELKKYGFLLNEQKTKIQRIGNRQSVTGIVVNDKPSVPIEYRRKLRQEIYYSEKFGIENHLKRTENDISPDIYIRKLLGQVNYVLSVNPNDSYFLKCRELLNKKIKNKTDLPF